MRMPLKLWSNRRRRSRGAPRRGVVMILVVVVLVLLAVIGAAYLTVVRVDRMANRQLTDNIELVLSAVLAEVGRELEDDVVFIDRKSVNNPQSGWSFSQIGNARIDREPYDRPGPRDVFLADLEPTGSSGSYTYQRFTNLGREDPSTGDLKYQGPGYDFVQFNAADSKAAPMESAGLASTPIAQSASNHVAADADADGIKDSRWKVAPIDRIGGTRYYFGVRIVDHGAMINANVWTWFDPGQFSQFTQPRCWFPMDLDMAAVINFASAPPFTNKGAVGEVTGNGGWIQNRLTPLDINGNPDVGNRIPLNPYVSRLDYWSNGPGVGFSAALPDGGTPSNEQELRHGNGLNSDFDADIEDWMPTLLRRNLGRPETSHPGGDLIADPRHIMTTMSGSSQSAPAAWGRGATTMVSLPLMWHTSPSVAKATQEKFANLLLKDPDMPFYDGTTTGHPTQATNQSTPWGPNHARATARYLACLVDYYDGHDPINLLPPGSNTIPAKADSRITKIVGIPNIPTAYGMEALPFFTELHVYATYKIVQVQANDDDNDPGTPDVYDIQWEVLAPGGAPSNTAAPVSIALEMINPFHSPVRNLDHVRLVWDANSDGQIPDAESDANFKLLSDLVNDPGGDLPQRETIVLRTLTDGEGGDAQAKLGYTVPADHHELPTDIRFQPADASNGPVGQVMFALQVKSVDSNGAEDWVTYCRVHKNELTGANKMEFPAKWDGSKWVFEKMGVMEPAGGPPVVDSISYVQRGSLCVAEALNPIAVVCQQSGTNDFTEVTDTQTEPSAEARAFEADLDQIGNLTKGGLASPVGVFASDNTYAYAFDDVSVRYPTDLLRVMWIGPDPDQNLTYAEVLNDTTGSAGPNSGGYAFATNPTTGAEDILRSRMLTFQDVRSGTVGSRLLSRGMLLMDRVVAMPVNSGQPIPGRMNLNTVSRRIFENAVPLANVSAIWSQIDAARLNSNYPRINETGIASLGELLPRKDGGGADIMASMRLWGSDGTFTPTDGVAIASDGGGNPIANGPIDDRTEEVRLAGFLMNLCSVRSDYFTAYIAIRGHRDDFHSQEESGQFLAVFDRTVLPPRIVTVYRVK